MTPRPHLFEAAAFCTFQDAEGRPTNLGRPAVSVDLRADVRHAVESQIMGRHFSEAIASWLWNDMFALIDDLVPRLLDPPEEA